LFCHLKSRGLTNGRGDAVGAYQVKISRSPPTLWNIGYYAEFYWDGRTRSLEELVKDVWSGPILGASGKKEHPSREEICRKLDAIDGYRQQFQEVFNEGCTPDKVAKAIAAFGRTIVANNSAWARFRAGDESALSEKARRGWEIFRGKGRCTNCHDGMLLTDQQYHNIGIGIDAENPDLGRYKVTKNEVHRGAFKTPTLLDISKSAPYFHDGSAAKLEDAVDIMLGGGIDNAWLDRPNLRPPVKLTKQERQDLLAFLRELTVEYTVTPPRLPK
jgi:cytochrome c peroxidase